MLLVGVWFDTGRWGHRPGSPRTGGVDGEWVPTRGTPTREEEADARCAGDGRVGEWVPTRGTPTREEETDARGAGDRRVSDAAPVRQAQGRLYAGLGGWGGAAVVVAPARGWPAGRAVVQLAARRVVAVDDSVPGFCEVAGAERWQLSPRTCDMTRMARCRG